MEFPSPSSVRIDEAGAVAEDHRKRRKKAHIKWKVYAHGKGWAQVLLFLRTIARTECDSCELGSRGHPSSNKTTIEYTFQCHYRGKPWYCDWRVKVCTMYRTQICFWGEVGITTSQRGGQSRGAQERFVCNQGPSRRQPLAQRSHCDLLSGCSSYVCCGCTRLSGDVCMESQSNQELHCAPPHHRSCRDPCTPHQEIK
jgi:hypothetical protein